MGKLRGQEIYISNTYSLYCHHQNDSALRWAVVWAILMFSLSVWAKSQDSVHKPQFLKRRERRAEADRTEVLLLTSQAPYHWATPAHERFVWGVLSCTHRQLGGETCDVSQSPVLDIISSCQLLFS